jgi:hypothetical protein
MFLKETAQPAIDPIVVLASPDARFLVVQLCRNFENSMR